MSENKDILKSLNRLIDEVTDLKHQIAQIAQIKKDVDNRNYSYLKFNICHICGMDFSGATGYACSNINCPKQSVFVSTSSGKNE